MYPFWLSSPVKFYRMVNIGKNEEKRKYPDTIIGNVYCKPYPLVVFNPGLGVPFCMAFVCSNLYYNSQSIKSCF
uniref:Uncharacterized protein n=1 Tax=Anguilla anguilla TaxID=7936 RepID=A0A0E9SLW1_ANGAN